MSIFNQFFYHQLLKKYATVFGALFSDIQVVRYNEDGTENHRVTVPIMYAPKEKYVQRLKEDANLEKKPAIILPRMGYEMSGFQYDSERKKNKLHRVYMRNANGTPSGVFTPVPYDIEFTLYLTAKTQEEMFMMIEQIIPGFTPDFVFTIKAKTEPELSYDVPLVLLDFMVDDSYEGEFEDRRQINASMTFLMKAVFFGPMKTVGQIKRVETTIHNDIMDLSQIVVEAYIEGVPLADIKEEDDWIVRTTVTEYGN